MNFDTGSEEGDGPDPLLNSIMDAMSSMKEATADKIYQRIHKQGNTNFSKPQVDRALANALKYGIFEVRNNRYRIKEEPLDDEDTVYCRKAKNREQTPYRCENFNRGELNPEKDNRRFKAPLKIEEKKCIACGKLKKPKEIEKEIDKSPCTLNSKNLKSGINPKGTKKKLMNEEPRKRKSHSNANVNEDCKKRRQCDHGKTTAKRTPGQKNKKKAKKCSNRLRRDVSPDPIAKYFPRGGFKDSETSLLTSYKLNAIECCEMVDDDENPSTSNVKVFTLGDEKGSESDCSDTSAVSAVIDEKRKDEKRKDEKKEDKNKKEEEPPKKPADSKDQNVQTEKLGKKSLDGKEKLQEPNRTRAKSIEIKSEWHPEEIHGGATVRQTNNALTVEPMDALPFKNPEGASYYT